MSRAILKDFDDSLPIRDILKQAWLEMFHFISNHQDYYRFTEQFSNSPFAELVDKEKMEQYFVPLLQTLERGVAQKIIRKFLQSHQTQYHGIIFVIFDFP